MIYSKPLPRMDSLELLANKLGRFPMTRREVSKTAKNRGFRRSVLDFIKLFPEDETFETRLDFITRCEELELFIREERNLPDERLRSPQD